MTSIKGLFLVLTLLTTQLLPTQLYANGKDSIAYLEQILTKGKGVAILVIDMQTGFPIYNATELSLKLVN